MNQTYSKEFFCLYRIQFYPFDTQVNQFLVINFHAIFNFVFFVFVFCYLHSQVKTDEPTTDRPPETKKSSKSTEDILMFISSNIWGNLKVYCSRNVGSNIQNYLASCIICNIQVWRVFVFYSKGRLQNKK